ncbi:MAG TPA: rhodanese-like domain-containing protein [Blastocatellia bacterium]|nr:rhodanese-like domain-containing protein [Blastocatellia bacterium]
MEPARITVNEVSRKLNNGEPIVFVDSRNPNAWKEADTKLPGAIRVPADEVEKHIADIARDRMVVTYCT